MRCGIFLTLFCCLRQPFKVNELMFVQSWFAFRATCTLNFLEAKQFSCTLPTSHLLTIPVLENMRKLIT